MDDQNKLKINDSKTEFIIFRSPVLKQNLSDFSINVEDSQVFPSSKVRDLDIRHGVSCAVALCGSAV